MLVLANFITAMTGLAACGPDADPVRCPDRRVAEVVDLAEASRGDRYIEVATFFEYRGLVAGFGSGLVPDEDRQDYFDVSRARMPFDRAVEAFFERLSGCDGFRFVVVLDRTGVVPKRIEIAAGAKSIPAVLWQNECLTDAVDEGFEWRLAA